MIRLKTLVAVVALVLAGGCRRGEPAPGAESVPAPPETVAGDTALPAVVEPAEVAVVDPEAEAPPPARTLPPARKVAPASPAERPQAAPAEPPPPPPPPTAAAGTEIVTVSDVEITTRRNKPGEQFTARVSAPVTGPGGGELIPAGAVVTFRIVDIKEAENKDAAGVLVISPVSVAFGGASYPIAADVTELAIERKGRGVTAGDAGKVAAGAAAGAILGKILTKKGTGAVVGGAVGAAAGTAIAVNTADKDLVIPPGARIVLKLTSDLVLQD